MSRTRRIIGGLLVTAALWPAAAAHAADAPTGERYALLVGVRQYSEAKELRPLPYTENDVTELAQVLKDGGYQPDNVVLMTQAAGADQLRYLPMKARILKELGLLLANRTTDDTVLLAFAGHGVVFKGDPASYFCPADARLDDRDTLLSLTEVYRQLEACKAGTKVLLVDACRNDPLADGSRAVAKLDLDSATRPPEPARDGGVAAFFSCSRGQKAYEDDKSRHGAFFHFVIEGMRGEAAPNREEVTLLDLAAYVTGKVKDFARSEYQAEQKPELETTTVKGSPALLHVDRAGLLYRQAEESLDAQDYDKAVERLTAALAVNPKFADALAQRARAYNGKQSFDKAVADCDAALRLDADSASAYWERAWAHAALNDPDKAIADYSACVRLNPKDAEAFHNRGDAYAAKEDYDKAIVDYTEAVRLDPNYAAAFEGRGNAWQAKGDHDKAVTDFGEAIRLDPKNAGIFCDRAQAWIDKQDYDKAIADYNEAIRLDPNYFVSFDGRGTAWLAKGEYDKAIADYTEAIRLDPKNAVAFKGRGTAYQAKGDSRRAKADFKKADELDKMK